MTLAPTHIALEAFLVWAGMGKKSRSIFREKRGLFALLSLFALFPDLDTFLYIHRTYLHSITWPVFLILGVLVYLIVMKYIKKTEITDKADVISRSIIIVGAFILLHDILDLTTGPILLFYPFDNRLIDLEVYMIWDLDFPLLIRGLQFDWSTVSLNEGINTYFLNLTPQERIDYFGTEFIALYVADFPLHLTIFLAWFIFFPGIAFYNWLNRYQKPQKFFLHFKDFKSPLLAFGLILLTFGSILGPAFKLQRFENRDYSTNLSFSEESTNYGVIQSFELDGNDILTLQGNFAGNNSYCTIEAAIATEDLFSATSTQLSNLFEEYNDNASISYSTLITNYKVIINDFFGNSLQRFVVIQNSTETISYTLDSNERLYSVLFLTDWNSTSEFTTQVQIKSTLTIQRPLEFYFGLSFMIIGFILMSGSITTSIITKRKGISEKSEVEDNQQLEEIPEIKN